MKIFDWKRRKDYITRQKLNDVTHNIFTFANLKSAPGSRKRRKRKGRGISAGKGASCGFGMRGQKSRSGKNVHAGFEGGQTPLYRRIPKLVGRPMGAGHSKVQYNLIKLDFLNGVNEGEVCNSESLSVANAITKSKHLHHKIVDGREEFKSKGIIVEAHAFTKSAKKKIEKNGGFCRILKHSN